jgi:ABC-2 type transport system ATP-binding protein
MKQRLKYALVLLRGPDFLFLDEPTANLDDDGKTFVSDLIKRKRERSVIVIATNETQEASFAQQKCRLG